MFQFSKKSEQRLLTADLRLQQIAHRALELSKIDFGIPEFGGKRTAQEQLGLYKAHKSNCDGIVKKSKHQSGLALDFYAFVNGKASWDKYHLAMVAAAFLQAANELGYKLTWGGLWTTFEDYPHVQVED